jgi:hypothetical protein
MSVVSQMYLGLSLAQQKLLGHLVSQGVRTILREGPVIDAAMSAALLRHRATPGSQPPRLQISVEVEVIEYCPDEPSGRPILSVEGGDS